MTDLETLKERIEKLEEMVTWLITEESLRMFLHSSDERIDGIRDEIGADVKAAFKESSQ